MIFLKKFEGVGFKSFGEPISVEFKHPMTGIIGPNGTGKSNVVDALKWVIGEQSSKTLRGHKNDLLYAGSRYTPKATVAKVSLYFNNVNQILKSEEQEIKVTRIVNTKTDESSYFINDQVVRLKDVIEMFLDSGLSKGSLGIINQGAVAWFAEAKPAERRKVFEEAAGIGRYTKKKHEANNALDKANENLNRIADTLAITQKELAKLKHQAQRFEEYKRIKNELTELELTILTRNITHWQKVVSQIKDQLANNDKELELIRPQVEVEKNSIQEIRDQYDHFNNMWNDLYNQKSNLENESKHAADQLHALVSDIENAAVNAKTAQERLDAYQQLIAKNDFDLNDLDQQQTKHKQEVANLQTTHTKNYEQISSLTKSVQNLSSELNKLKTAKEYLEAEINSRSSYDRGVKAIVDTKNALPGVYGTVLDNIKTHKDHELAITTALGKAINNIIVRNNNVAINCVEFLKKNNAGSATFLPVENLVAKTIKPEFIDALKTLKGYVGVASSLVKIKNEYNICIQNLLGNIIIAEDINAAAVLSEYTYKNYKVVTLEGEIVFAGGAIQGGSSNHKKIIINLEEELANISSKYDQVNNNLISQQSQLNTIQTNNISIQNQINIHQTQLASIEGKIISTKELRNNNIANYNSLSTKAFDPDSAKVKIDDLNLVVANKNQQIKDLEQQMLVARNNANDFLKLQRSKEEAFETLKTKFDKLNNDSTINKMNLEKLDLSINNAASRIVENYEMTVEYATELYANKELELSEAQANFRIENLKTDLAQFKNINLNALAEYEEKQKEFDLKQAEFDQATQAVEAIRSTIAELDKKARADFMHIINETNKLLPEIFQYLFNGGSCAVALEDSNNILESGIEIFANPPSKKNVKLNALSGGEKTLVVLAVLFSILKIANFPLVILDEAEAALDVSNVDKFSKIIEKYSDNTQFLIITHREGTMKACGRLVGTTMMNNGITSLLEIDLKDAKIKYESEIN
ncbi:hypothetical protein JM47_00045 [Ureaplasma diversum]|uniref:Chromosome partition protein Smc n=1 Tax=Ureaplasma diversum TaxID=42094 RepID=A0A0C5RK81_9BACT|nr:AAA family ATPase [Ureaplasma diversum]AJQ45073.1 hypothetical protein JM47_00045 [Ureaplasma diversum]